MTVDTLGATTGSFYQLDQRSGAPISRVIDSDPGITVERVTMSTIDNEVYTSRVTVSKRRMMDLSTASSNAHREPKIISVTGSFNPIFINTTVLVSASANPLGFALKLPPTPLFGGRPDITAAEALEELQGLIQPVMFASPRVSLPLCMILEISRPWSVDDGDATPVTVLLEEIRTVGEGTVTAIPDTDSLAPGNIQEAGAGGSTATPVSTPGATPPANASSPPSFLGGLA